VAFGPIVSKYNLPHINEKIIKQIIVKSIEKINHIYIDENGLGKEKVKILKIIKDLELEIVYI
jgi:D-aminoacyl-tRNA deacylase